MIQETDAVRYVLGHEVPELTTGADRVTGGLERGRHRDVAAPGAPGQAPAATGEADEWVERGTRVRRGMFRARRGYYAPLVAGAPTTTRQAEVLNTALIAAPTDDEGVAIGRDVLSQTVIAHDTFTAYRKRQISSPNVLVLGDVGAGKSALCKTVYVLRPLILRNRRAVVMDKKDEGGEGEYAALTRRFGSEPLRFVAGAGGVRLNLFDPAIYAVIGALGEVRLLTAITELAQGGTPLDQWEREALRVAHRATRTALDGVRVPVLGDLVERLGVVPGGYADMSARARGRLHEAGIGVRFLLSGLLEELHGMFDGETSPGVKLSERLTTFDVSQLPDDGPAVSMVVTVANVWLLGVLRTHRGLATNFVAEEGWHLIGGPSGRVLQSNAKLARGLGLANIIALHKIADIPTDSPAIALVKEAQTVHLYRQSRADDIAACVRLFNLDPGSANTLGTLKDGHHLLKIGTRPEVHVEHVRSALEVELTNTDTAMLAGGQGRS